MSVWTMLLDHLEWIAFCTAVIIATLGLLALILVWTCWKLISSRYREFWAKLAVAFFRFMAAASALASKSAVHAPGQPLLEQPWTPTLLIAIVGYFLWEFVGAIGDHKFKLAKEQTKKAYEQEIETLTQDKDDAEQQFIRLSRIVSYLRGLENEKLQRIKQVLRDSGTRRGSLPQTRAALAPSQQSRLVLEILAAMLHVDAASAGGHYNQNFRIGLYAEQNGLLLPLDAFDLNTRSHEPFSSYRKHADRFRLDNDVNPSHAVRCVREARLLIVPDCANHPMFQYFNDQQRNYLRSMVAYPLSDFCPDGSNPVQAALVIDTDVAGFFQEKDSQIMKIYLKEFAVRLALE